MKREKIGEIFVKAELISHDDLDHVLAENRAFPDEKLGQTLVRLNFGSETDVARALSFQLDIPYIDLSTVIVDPRAIKQIPLELAIQEHILPVYIEKNDLVLAMEEPQDFDTIEKARFTSGLNIRPHVAAASDIVAAIKRYYSIEESIGAITQNITPGEDVELLLDHLKLSEQQIQDLKKQSESPEIVKLVNTLIFQGIAVRASAIQIEPQKQDVLVKNKVDGVFVESMRIPRWIQGTLIARIKIMGGMDIAKRHVPQEGRIKLKMRQSVIDLSVSSLPSQYGECLIIHILETGETIPLIKELGLLPNDFRKLQELLQLSQGMILVCGPSSSGKTTTLYSLANELFRQQRRTVTLEASIGYRLKGVTQVQINETAGLTYAQALHSILRHNPDVILIGEIQDKETAEIAMQASMSTHLILSTLRTNDLMSTITRLKDLDADLQLFASSLSGMVSQRLVRKVCEQCREQYEPSSKLLEKIESRVGEKLSCVFYHGEGCEMCHYTGYQDRIGVYHVLTMSKGLRKFISQGDPEGKVRMAIKKAEMESLLKNTLEMVKQGLTTVEELDRVLFETEEFEGAEVLKCERCQKPVEPDWEVCRSCGHARKAPSSDGVEQIRTPAQIATSHIPQSEGYTFQGFKLLLVDDDDDMLQRLKFILLEKQFTITTAANGLEALEKIARDKPHLVVTDVMMPRMDGLELIRRLRKDITTTFIPVIILSAKQETADRLKGFAVGTDDYLPKPFSIHELFFRINAILKRVYK